MIKCEYLIVGGGILGLSTAYALQLKKPDSKVIVIEKENAPAKHQTGRNSGVIHAGVYYKPGSLKAKFCRAGVERTIDFCQKENVNFDQCGKLIVATNKKEDEALQKLVERSKANNLNTKFLHSAQEISELEPNVTGSTALLVKETGIVDYTAICQALVRNIENRGGVFYSATELYNLNETSDEIVAETSQGDIHAKKLVACAGLQADRVAAMLGLADDFCIIPFRGEYYKLSKSLNEIVSHLIYPVPDPQYPFLGIHLTRMVDGSVTVGPNALLSFGRENYSKSFPKLSDISQTLRFPGFWRFMSKNLFPALDELKGALSKKVYLERCQKYCPSLNLDDLNKHPSGIRAQAINSKGQLIDDFLIKQTKHSIHVCNAPSPAATSAFPIADKIVEYVVGKG